MGTRIEKREVGPLSVRAGVVPGSLNDEQRTVDVTWTTGARVKRSSWFDGPWYEELSTDPAQVRMGRLQSGRAPVLLQHNSYDPVAHQGVVTRASLSNGQGTATLRFLTGDPDADKTWNKIRQGVLTSVSVGYSVHRSEKVADLDGIPVMRATDWEPYEISPVSMPADMGAYMRSAAPTNVCEFIIRGEAPHEEEKKMADEVKPPAAAGDVGRKQDEIDVNAIAVKAALDERKRAEAINALVTRVKLPAEFAAELISGGKPLAEARAAVLDKLAERSDATSTDNHHSGVERGEDAADKYGRGAVAWLLQKSGQVDAVRKAQKAGVEGFEKIDLDPGEFRSYKLIDFVRENLVRRGVSGVKRMSAMELAGQVGIMRREAGFNTVSDFPVILENVLYKVLLGLYATTPDTWSKVCKTDTVVDFRAANRYRLGSMSVLDSVNESGEFKYKSIPDAEKHSISVDTKGNIIALTRKAIINDDMGALGQIAAQLGRAARLSIEVDFYALLSQNSGLGPTMADSLPFFDASRGNVNGTGSALSVSGIDADRVIMKAQTDPSGHEILDLKPEVLLVAAGLGATARVVNTAVYDPDANNKLQRPNPVVGLYSSIVDTARLTGTRRYSFADPGIAPAFVVAFLEGSNPMGGGQTPYMEQRMGFEVDGIEWKVRLDYKVQTFDWRGAVTNAGQ